MSAVSMGYPYQADFEAMTPQGPATDFYGGIEAYVIVAKNIPPRASQFEYMIEMGRGLVTTVFEDRDKRADLSSYGESTFLCFPERHMSVHEQRHFTGAVGWAIRPKLKRLHILTSSVFIVQCADALAVIEDPKYLLDTESGSWWWERERKKTMEEE
jgi:hypothetical protein